jgi:hypothetical protein
MNKTIFKNTLINFITLQKELANEISKTVRDNVPAYKMEKMIKDEKGGSLSAIDDLYASPAEIMSECTGRLFRIPASDKINDSSFFKEYFIPFAGSAWDMALANDFKQID